jgi:putative oxidoreductase
MAEDFGKLLLRLNVGGLLLLHGVYRLLNGLDPVRDMLAACNIPTTFAFGIYFGELMAPVLIMIGLCSRAGGILVALNMTAAILLQPETASFFADNGGFALEFEVFYLVGGLCITCLGAGRLAVGPKRWN